MRSWVPSIQIAAAQEPTKLIASCLTVDDPVRFLIAADVPCKPKLPKTIYTEFWIFLR